ncbi:F0F1 ATP synthase subunit gamma [Candidatus Woesebacteria bacterium]|nr:MAG: F0F1 ATP synthase subunit gamma [Candidatus Woesebacteria bacterium]
MSSQKEISGEIDQLKGFRDLVRAYEEIASLRMVRTRDTVVKNRKFLDEIEDIFEKVRASYASEVKKLIKKRNSKNNKAITFLAHNGKTVSVLLSANSGLYGSIVQTTFEQFAEETRNQDVEVTIVGKQGLNLFQTEFPEKPYTYFEIPDEKVKSDDLNEIVKHIVQYEEIHVYYGKFINVVSQKPDLLTISAEISLDDARPDVGISYIFEPSLEKILMFFETQIFAARFEQTAREGQLSKFASRVMAMDRADENISERVKKLGLRKLRIGHKENNRKQLNSLVSINMW